MAVLNQFLADDLMVLMNHPSPRIQYTARIMLEAMVLQDEEETFQEVKSDDA